MARNGKRPGLCRPRSPAPHLAVFWGYCAGNVTPGPETSGHFAGSTRILCAYLVWNCDGLHAKRKEQSKGARDWYPRSADFLGWDPLGQRDTTVHFRNLTLMDGLNLIPVTIGLFAIPELDIPRRIGVLDIENGAQ